VQSLYPQPTLLSAAAYDGVRVGLFGGSFNPAHRAHRQLAEYALRALDLDVIWWLVSPQNPLKSADDMAPLSARMASARKQITGPRMIVTDLESRLGTQYTADTIRDIKHHFPYTKFTWMMGADSLRTFHHWENWQDIARAVPIAVFARPPQQIRALSGFAAKALKKYRRINYGDPARRSLGKAGWRYIMMPLNPLSATQIRKLNAEAKKSLRP
jgi:nicotinate-nucleotide adenylyltransferase